MTWKVDEKGKKLIASFRGGPAREWVLPNKGDVPQIQKIRREIVQFVEENGGSDGQWRAGHKELSGHGWYAGSPRRR